MSDTESFKADTNAPEAESEPATVATALAQLRTMVCGLGAGLLVVSIALTVFIWKQNRNLKAATNHRRTQLAQVQMVQRQIHFVVDQLAQYSVGKPELEALFTKHGAEITPPVAPAR